MRSSIRVIARMTPLCALAVTAALFVLPVTATAHTKTRILVTPEVRVDNSVAGATPAAPVVTARLYRKSGKKYKALSKQVLCYFIDPTTGRLSLEGEMTGSTVSFALPRHGRYQLLFFGTGKYKRASAETRRIDSIGAVLSTPTVTITRVDGTYSQVTFSSDVTWNTDAYSGPVMLTTMGFFTEHPEGGLLSLGAATSNTLYGLTVYSPQTVTFSYRFKTVEAIGSLLMLAAVGPEDSLASCVDAGSGGLRWVVRDQP